MANRLFFDSNMKFCLKWRFPLKVTQFGRLTLVVLFAFSFASHSFAQEKTIDLAANDAGSKTIKAMLITGGCCHDYPFQANTLVEASSKQVNIKWTVINEGGRGTKAQIKLYDNPNWAKGYDVIVHNECFAGTTDADYIKKITAIHKAGVPAVVIHCAMHTYRSSKVMDWREFLGVTSFRHEHQSNYTVVNAAKDHPIMKAFPATWKTPKDELYVIDKLWPNAKTLATTKSEKTGKTHPSIWINNFGKARVFGTTWGHGNVTWKDPVFVATITRGMLWAAGALGEDGKPKANVVKK
jgi:uncharacterized protein